MFLFKLRFKLVELELKSACSCHCFIASSSFVWVQRWDFYLTSMLISIFECWVWIPNTYSCAFAFGLDWIGEYSNFWYFEFKMSFATFLSISFDMFGVSWILLPFYLGLWVGFSPLANLMPQTEPLLFIHSLFLYFSVLKRLMVSGMGN